MAWVVGTFGIAFVLLLLQATLTVAVTTCPTEDIYPEVCLCVNGTQDNDASIYCALLPTTNLTHVFDTIATVVNKADATFEMLSLQPKTDDAQRFEILPEVMTDLKFRTIQLLGFSTLVKIHPDSFPSTYNYTEELRFSSVIFYEDFTNPQSFIRKFQNLKNLRFWLGISPTIPDRAFDGMINLQSITYDFCMLRKIESRPFANVPNLRNLTLVNNMFTAENFSKEAFTGLHPDAKVDLSDNHRLTYLPESVFKELLDTTNQPVDITQNIPTGQYIMECDAKAHWICNNATMYKSKLRGFACKDRTYSDIFAYCDSIEKSPSSGGTQLMHSSILVLLGLVKYFRVL